MKVKFGVLATIEHALGMKAVWGLVLALLLDCIAPPWQPRKAIHQQGLMFRYWQVFRLR